MENTLHQMPNRGLSEWVVDVIFGSGAGVGPDVPWDIALPHVDRGSAEARLIVEYLRHVLPI